MASGGEYPQNLPYYPENAPPPDYQGQLPPPVAQFPPPDNTIASGGQYPQYPAYPPGPGAPPPNFQNPQQGFAPPAKQSPPPDNTMASGGQYPQYPTYPPGPDAPPPNFQNPHLQGFAPPATQSPPPAYDDKPGIPNPVYYPPAQPAQGSVGVQAMVITSAPPPTQIVRVVQQAQPNDYLGLAILVTFFCCLVFGIVAIIKSQQVRSRYAAGDMDGAIRASNEAKGWSIAGIVGGVVIGTIVGVINTVF